MPVVGPKARPLVLLYARRPVSHNWAPIARADVAGGVITYKVMDGDTQVGATGAWNAADVVLDVPVTGDLWPGHPWNVEGQLAAGYLDVGGRALTVVVEFPLTGGETIVHAEPVSTENVPGYGEP